MSNEIGSYAVAVDFQKTLSEDAIKRLVEIIGLSVKRDFAGIKLVNIFIFAVNVEHNPDSILVVERFLREAKKNSFIAKPVTLDLAVEAPINLIQLELLRSLLKKDGVVGRYSIMGSFKAVKNIVHKSGKTLSSVILRGGACCASFWDGYLYDVKRSEDLILDLVNYGTRYINILVPCRFWCNVKKIKQTTKILPYYRDLFTWSRQFVKYNKGVLIFPLTGKVTEKSYMKPLGYFATDGDDIFKCRHHREKTFIGKLFQLGVEKKISVESYPEICNSCSEKDFCGPCNTAGFAVPKITRDNWFCKSLKYVRQLQRRTR